MSRQQGIGNYSRRSTVKGLAWSVPIVTAASAAPAYAASTRCSRTEIVNSFADAQAYAEANYYCNGQPAQLEINFYTPPGSLNGFVQDAYINVKNLSSCNISFSQQYPLHLDIQVRNNNVVNNQGRSLGRISTSWGTWTLSGNVMNNSPVGSVDSDIDWSFAGTLPGNGLGDNEADLIIGFNDGATGVGRWNNYLTLTPMQDSGAPPLESFGLSRDNPGRLLRCYLRRVPRGVEGALRLRLVGSAQSRHVSTRHELDASPSRPDDRLTRHRKWSVGRRSFCLPRRHLVTPTP